MQPFNLASVFGVPERLFEIRTLMISKSFVPAVPGLVPNYTIKIVYNILRIFQFHINKKRKKKHSLVHNKMQIEI